MTEISRGVPYSVAEARLAATRIPMDKYLSSLVLWLCGEVEKLRDEKLRNVTCEKCGYMFMHRSGYERHPCPPPPDYDFAAP